MSFTLPVGNFQSSALANALVRPSGVVDTVGTGTITNSNLAFDTSKTTYGLWTAIVPENTYSIFVFSASGTTLNKSVYILWSSDLFYPNWYGGMSMSIDNGVTYPYGVSVHFTSNSPVISSIIIPDGTAYSNIKLNVGPQHTAHAGLGSQIDTRVYDIYIQ